MYYKFCWGFSGTDEQKETQKDQLVEVLRNLGASVDITPVKLDSGEDCFVIKITK